MMQMTPTTHSGAVSPQRDRVREHTAPYVNERIDAVARVKVYDALQSGSRDAIVYRLAELDREWDIDRALMVHLALLGGTAFGLGLARSRSWLYLLGAQLGFLLLHATAGWSPPASVMRRLGFRTQQEIGEERRKLLDRLREMDSEARGSRPDQREQRPRAR